MAHGLNNGIAKFLAILSVFAMLEWPSHADDGGISLPQSRTEPVTLRLPPAAPEQTDPTKRLRIYVGGAQPCCEGRTAMAGRYALTDDTLLFSPAFGFDPGQDYIALFLVRDTPETVAFRIPLEVTAVPTLVTEIFPSGGTLPENTLRFYIHFSVPMTPHVAFDYIKLRDASGTVDDAAFMRFKQELWNADRTRLTVLIDPGRIKREVTTNAELGPALVAGQEYTLSVEGGWSSADGLSVLPPYSRTFTVSTAQRERPDVRYWQAIEPCLGTTEPLRINFDRPFDRHLLSKDIQVISKDRQFVPGRIQVDAGETAWSFTPDKTWSQSELLVVANTDLEDVAGNNFRDLLDHSETRADTEAATSVLPITLNRCSR